MKKVLTILIFTVLIVLSSCNEGDTQSSKEAAAINVWVENDWSVTHTLKAVWGEADSTGTTWSEGTGIDSF